MLGLIKLEQDTERPYITKLSVDGKQIDHVKCAYIKFLPLEIPTTIIEIKKLVDLNGITDIKYDFTPNTAEQAIAILRSELLKHGDLYTGFLASIKSALDDYGYEKVCLQDDNEEIAFEILKRVIGEE